MHPILSLEMRERSILSKLSNEIELLKDGATLVSFIWPAQNPELMEQLSSRNINVMAMDLSCIS